MKVNAAIIDEINHMTKFWGFGMWAYPDSSLVKVGQTLGKAMVRKFRDRTSQGSLLHTLRRMMDELAWEQWSSAHRLTFLYTLDQVMQVLWNWHQELIPDYLETLFGKHPYRCHQPSNTLPPLAQTDTVLRKSR
jgi:hypothetical protein